MTQQIRGLRKYLTQVAKELEAIKTTVPEEELYNLHSIMFIIRINSAQLADKVDNAFAKHIKERDGEE